MVSEQMTLAVVMALAVGMTTMTLAVALALAFGLKAYEKKRLSGMPGQ